MTEDIIKISTEEVARIKKIPKQQLTKNPKQPRVRVIVFQGSYHEEVNAKIKEGHFLVFKTSDRVKHKIMIATPPVLMKTKRHIFGKFLNVYYSGYFDEITKDPDRLEYDLPMLEGIVKLTNAVCDTHILKKVAEAVKAPKMLREYIPWFLFFFSNVIWIIFMYTILDKVAMFKQ